ncbi:MAG: TraB/GumN family protein [Caulobacteraceae bacterium]|nr:MAG: TraB/GumN family protein [Caulobacteraceae bacterium]
MTAVIKRPLLTTALLSVMAIWSLTGPGATAQPSPAAGDDPEGTLVEELVISSNLGGPAFWKVSDGDTTVYVLGAPGSLPRGTRWDERRLALRLDGARALILPPKIKARPVVMTAFFLGNQKKFQGGPPVDGALAARLERARAGLKVKPATLAKWKPGVQGAILAGELQKPLKMDDDQPAARIIAMARKARVRQVRAGAAIDPMPAVKSLLSLDEAGHRICLEDALDEVEAGRGRIREAADGWARGDVKAALRAERGFDRCLARLPLLASLSRRAMTDTSGAIARQMAVPGKAVAVVELRQLLARGGVLDQLRARGFRVETPASAG